MRTKTREALDKIDKNRDFCPFCQERVRHAEPDGIEVCPEHGVLEGVTDEEWETAVRELEGR